MSCSLLYLSVNKYISELLPATVAYLVCKYISTHFTNSVYLTTYYYTNKKEKKGILQILIQLFLLQTACILYNLGMLSSFLKVQPSGFGIYWTWTVRLGLVLKSVLLLSFILCAKLLHISFTLSEHMANLLNMIHRCSIQTGIYVKNWSPKTF